MSDEPARVIYGTGEPTRYVCPHGHAFPRHVSVKCELCDAYVACVPSARVHELVSELAIMRGLVRDFTELRTRADMGDLIARAKRALS